MIAREVLKKYWGFDKFRPLQEEIINAAIKKQNLIALLPTGGGKSICFQIPGLLSEGITLVISPLISLMEDQVLQLKEKNISALNLSSAQSETDLLRLLDNAEYGAYKFIYSSPEKLQNDLVKNRLLRLNISHIVFDEAHCISQWGHDFRPAYKKITELSTLFPRSSTLCLTATATPEVIADIRAILSEKNYEVFRGKFDRENLIYKVDNTKNKLLHLQKHINTYHVENQSTIVYTNSRKKTQEIAQRLNSLGYKTGIYHGGLDQLEKTQTLHSWLSNELSIVVATNAFGMGIDKGNVNLVIHYDLPYSIENYIQEAGRAGRLGQPSHAILMTNENELDFYEKRQIKDSVTLEKIKQVYFNLNQYFKISYGTLELNSFGLNFNLFCKQYHLPVFETYSIFKLLHNEGLILLKEVFKDEVSIQLNRSPEEFYGVIDRNKDLEPIVSKLLRSYPGLFDEEIQLDLSYIGKSLKYSKNYTLSLLERLKKMDLILLNHINTDLTIKFLQPREDDRTINRYARNLEFILDQKKSKSLKVLHYVRETRICRKVYLIEYFSKESVSDCGECDVCKKKINFDTTNCEREVLEILSSDSLDLEELLLKSKYPKEDLISTLKVLLHKEEIIQTKFLKFKIHR